MSPVAICTQCVRNSIGRQFCFSSHSVNFDGEEQAGDPVARDVSAFAEFERDRIGERIRATKRAQKARGEYLGGPPPFGFAYDTDRRLVPVPDQQKALRRIRTLHAEGLSPYKISADLALRGVKLSHVTVRKIITDRQQA